MEWFTVQPRSKLRNESRKSKKSSGVPTTTGALLIAVVAKGALMSSFSKIVISIWPILAFGLDHLILRYLGGEIWCQSGFDRNAPRICMVMTLMPMSSGGFEASSLSQAMFGREMR